MTSADERSRETEQALKPASNVWPTLGVAALLFLLAAHERLLWPQVLGCALVAMVAVSFFTVVRPLALAVDVEAPARVVVGEPFDMCLRIENPRTLRRRDMVVRCRWRSRRPVAPALSVFVDVEAGTTVVRVRTAATARGVAGGVDIDIDAAGPFGFFSRVAKYSARHRLVVVPASGRELSVLAGAGRRPGVVPGYLPDVDVRGVRDWRPGDRIGEVHWRSVVRTGRMTVVERDGGSAGSLVVLVVAPADKGKPVVDPRFESALSVAASTAAAALRQGVPTCFVANTRNIGVKHLDDDPALLDCFARLDVAKAPSEAMLDHVVAHAAHGGVVLVVLAKTASASTRVKVFDAVAAVGAMAVDVTENVTDDEAEPNSTRISA